MVAGSCSLATRGQIDHVRTTWPHRKVDLDRIADGDDVIGETLAWAADVAPDQPLLIYGSADPGEVQRNQERYGRAQAGEMLENALSAIAKGLVDLGVRHLISAGGETSGAVVSALGVKALRIGPEIDPGVPWCETLGGLKIALALKSGNFGSEDFFSKAFGMLS